MPMANSTSTAQITALTPLIVTGETKRTATISRYLRHDTGRLIRALPANGHTG
jgi:hypothetical protein